MVLDNNRLGYVVTGLKDRGYRNVQRIEDSAKNVTIAAELPRNKVNLKFKFVGPNQWVKVS